MGAWQCGASCRTMSPSRAAGPPMTAILRHPERRVEGPGGACGAPIVPSHPPRPLDSPLGMTGPERPCRLCYSPEIVQEGEPEEHVFPADGGPVRTRYRLADGKLDGELLQYDEQGQLAA